MRPAFTTVQKREKPSEVCGIPARIATTSRLNLHCAPFFSETASVCVSMWLCENAFHAQETQACLSPSVLPNSNCLFEVGRQRMTAVFDGGRWSATPWRTPRPRRPPRWKSARPACNDSKSAPRWKPRIAASGSAWPATSPVAGCGSLPSKRCSGTSSGSKPLGGSGICSCRIRSAIAPTGGGDVKWNALAPRMRIRHSGRCEFAGGIGGEV